ncbi:hypothetical protein FPOAC1_002411 [Fusarium poae]|uniref:hypothetical protein n=1 Tax=Fusarium poae TaxID=36050 RepID=UPI001CEBD4AD|nr:hypothetical protein FPOAC1_002411 [Fusarium poae]KAG8676408.1 hypothetical protein FPOAC1_002411 [Fusarium poae]
MLGRAFWRDSLQETPRKSFQLSLLLDDEDYRDEHTTLRFMKDSWTEALFGDEFHSPRSPIHHSGLDHGNKLLIIFRLLVSMDHPALSILGDLLPFRAPIDFYSRYLVSTSEYYDTCFPSTFAVVLGDGDIHGEHIYRFRLGRSIFRAESCSWVILIALRNTDPRLRVQLLGASLSRLCWSSVGHWAIELCSLLCIHGPILAVILRTGAIVKWKILFDIEIQGAMQRERSQAYRMRDGGLITNCLHICLAMLNVERLPDDRQRLSLWLVLNLSFSFQQKVPLQTRIKRADASNYQSRWFLKGTTRDVNQGQDCADGTQNRGSHSEKGQKHNKQNARPLQRPLSWPFRSGQKRSATSEELPEEDDNDGSSDKNPHKRRRLENDKTNPRFACPFFKHSPTKFIGERSCCGPGWINVQRVKEHIFRKHAAPEFQCSRCFTDFERHSDLDEHQRSTVACEVRDRPSAPLHVDKGTMQLLKQRKKSTGPVTESDKWYTMYEIIFPHETHVPSPYYELEEKVLTSPSEATVEEMFQKNLKETLPVEALTDMRLMNLIMPGVMSAFNRTLSALNDQKTTVLPVDIQQTITTSTSSWPEDTRRYAVERSPSQADITVKDEPTNMCIPLSHFDSANQFQMHTSSLGLDSMQSEANTSDTSWEAVPNSAVFVDTTHNEWNFGDDAIAETGNIQMDQWIPFDYGCVWSEEVPRD